MKLRSLDKWASDLGNTQKMPVLFLGHGSPMNAIEENEFVRGFRQAAKEIPTPSAILCISAHWETNGTLVTAMENPKTIHDFGGFPKQLYEVQYPAPGSPELAKEVQSTINTANVELDHSWGLDHGAWSVIKHLYPKANIPVIQMSLDHRKDPKYHYELARELSILRQKGVLIIGSGNIVHNLRMVDWKNLNKVDYAYDWATEAHSRINDMILSSDHRSLIEYRKQGRAFQLSVPTPEHFLPLLYTLGLQDKDDDIALFNDRAIAGSLTMTSVKIGC
ncbi:MAG: 4,5-DOPA dioxygenase extradiol [Saprospiraceae bacterium]|nr:4,5-DOPA dioxygenase extradiol [Saprospiraceae bacterium]